MKGGPEKLGKIAARRTRAMHEPASVPANAPSIKLYETRPLPWIVTFACVVPCLSPAQSASCGCIARIASRT